MSISPKLRIEQLNKAIKVHEEMIKNFESMSYKTKDKELEIENLKKTLNELIVEHAELS